MKISIIFQGAVDTRPSEKDPSQGTTEFCLRATRRAFPNAELILSTWESRPELIPLVDQIIVNNDPGGLISDNAPKNFLTNFNRQMVSTLGGLNAASNDFAVKIRTDSWLESPDCISYLEKLSPKERAARLFTNRILVCALGCASMTRWPAPYHLSDLFHFGKKEDLINLWSLPFCPKEYADWHFQRNTPKWRRGGEGLRPERMAPEQYLLAAFLKKVGFIDDMPTAMIGGSLGELVCSEKAMIENFIFIPGELIGLRLPERLAIYDREKHFSFRSDWKTVNWIGKSQWMLNLYVYGRALLMSWAKLIYWGWDFLRPLIGEKGKFPIKKILMHKA